MICSFLNFTTVFLYFIANALKISYELRLTVLTVTRSIPDFPSFLSNT